MKLDLRMFDKELIKKTIMRGIEKPSCGCDYKAEFRWHNDALPEFVCIGEASYCDHHREVCDREELESLAKCYEAELVKALKLARSTYEDHGTIFK